MKPFYLQEGEIGALVIDVVTERHANFARRAVGLLGAARADAVPELAKALEAKSVQVRRNAVAALAELAHTQRQAIRILRQATKDEDETVRTLAAEALKHLDGGSEKK